MKTKTTRFFFKGKISNFSHFSTNYYVNSLQYNQFLNNNTFTYNSQPISGHSLNAQLKNTQKTTIVVGGGVVGVSTALYLCQNTRDNVILLEKLLNFPKLISQFQANDSTIEAIIIILSQKNFDSIEQNIDFTGNSETKEQDNIQQIESLEKTEEKQDPNQEKEIKTFSLVILAIKFLCSSCLGVF